MDTLAGLYNCKQVLNTSILSRSPPKWFANLRPWNNWALFVAGRSAVIRKMHLGSPANRVKAPHLKYSAAARSLQ
jgi:hypothetical protein